MAWSNGAMSLKFYSLLNHWVPVCQLSRLPTELCLAQKQAIGITNAKRWLRVSHHHSLTVVTPYVLNFQIGATILSLNCFQYQTVKVAHIFPGCFDQGIHTVQLQKCQIVAMCRKNRACILILLKEAHLACVLYTEALPCRHYCHQSNCVEIVWEHLGMAKAEACDQALDSPFKVNTRREEM